MSTPFEYCETQVRDADKDRFLATLFAPAATRPFLFALYAFDVEVARVRGLVSGPMPGEVRLQWWRDVLNGVGRGEVQAHPVAAALMQTMSQFDLPAQPLLDLIEGRSFDLYDDPMSSLAELEAYAVRISSNLMSLAVRILGAGDEPGLGAARPAGCAYAMTVLLTTFPFHASRGRLYIPLEVLDRHGVPPADIFAGKESAALTAALAEMRDHARRWFREFADASMNAAVRVAPAYLPVALVPLYLDRLERVPPFRTMDVPQWRRQWALWRASR